jgi:hypothetical protein
LRGNENILRAQGSLTVRVYAQHAVGVQFVATTRDDDPFHLSETFQSVGALSLFYTYLGDKKFGVTDWR